MLARSAAMCISEVMGNCICSLMHFSVPEPALVYVSEDFARSYDELRLAYRILEGYHFGTIENRDVNPSVPDKENLETYTNPLAWIRLWVIDSWMMNIDRSTYGNVLFIPSIDAKRKKWDILAIDHSDCFNGAGELVSGHCLDGLRNPSCVPIQPLFEQLVTTAVGIETLRQAIEEVKSIRSSIGSIIGQVPEQWWAESQIDPSQLQECLDIRAMQIDICCRLTHWESMYNDVNIFGQQNLPLINN